MRKNDSSAKKMSGCSLPSGDKRGEASRSYILGNSSYQDFKRSEPTYKTDYKSAMKKLAKKD